MATDGMWQYRVSSLTPQAVVQKSSLMVTGPFNREGAEQQANTGVKHKHSYLYAERAMSGVTQESDVWTPGPKIRRFTSGRNVNVRGSEEGRRLEAYLARADVMDTLYCDPSSRPLPIPLPVPLSGQSSVPTTSSTSHNVSSRGGPNSMRRRLSRIASRLSPRRAASQRM
mmetsp:Transcript_8141/g.24513  ORF Transcript_8141/g.24513 Transcript_8141/m.24513 type:complete len:170 (+) Transcript_8141:103-612(+)